MRFRVLLITIGAILVALTFTFPLWLQLFQRDQSDLPQEIFPGLAADLQDAFQILPPDQQAAYRAVAAEDRAKAVAMIEAALSAGFPAPTEQQELPPMTGAETIDTGAFTRVDAVRWAQGDFTLYQQVDESKILRFENFSVANAPGLRVALATIVEDEEQTEEEAPPEEEQSPIADIVTNGLDLGPLLGTTGNQNYDIASDIDVTQYNSVVIYSPTLEMIYSIAPLTV